MLQGLRDNMRGTLGAIVVGIIALVLMLSFGISSLAPTSNTGGEVASVNGEEITEFDLLRAINQRQSQLRAQFGDSLPEDFISEESLREPVLDSLINRLALQQAAKDAGLAVSDQRVGEMLREVPDFQIDGRFSRDRFTQLVRNVGYSPTEYQQQIKEDVVLQQLSNSFVATAFVTNKQLQQTTRLSQQKRDFYYLTVPLNTVINTIEVDDEQAQAYYQENLDNYQKPEEVSIEYIEILKSTIANGIQISEAELKQQYEQEVAAFDASVERHAAHILVESKDDGSHQQQLADIQARLQAGDEFAAVAEELSEDFGSSALGGDLGFSSGQTFPPEFESALATLEVGAVSEPVQTEAGFHIIKLLEVRGDQPPTFEQDKARIERALKNNLADEEFLSQTQHLEELAYNAEGLSTVAEEMGLTLGTAGPFARTGGFGIAARQEVVREAFSDDVLTQGNTSPLISLGDGHVVIIKNTEHLPSRALTFDEVKDQVVNAVKQDLARDRVADIGAEIVAEVLAGKSVEDAAKEREYEWQVSLNTERTNPQVRRELLNYVFSLAKPEPEQRITKGLSSGNGDYYVVSLFKVVDGDLTELETAEKKNLQQRLAGLAGQSDFAAFSELATAKADIDR